MSTPNGLNPEQLESVQHGFAPLLIAAPAGSGKTTVLVERVARMVKEGVAPERVLALTFSTKAAREMTDRLRRLGCTEARVGTFHSLAFQVVREELPEYAAWRVDDTDRFKLCVKDAVSYRYMDWKSADVTYLMSFIGRCKASGAYAKADDKRSLQIAIEMQLRRPTVSREPSLCLQAYEMAEMIRRERQLLGFDDMLFEAWSLFERDEAARLRWARRWEHVLQDECQDENHVQHELAAQLARDHRSYTIVGDPAQSIYGFRGADPSSLLKFEQEWNAHVVRLVRNYRSGSNIVEVANKSLAAMPLGTHLGVEMVAHRAELGEVKLTEYENFDDEGEGVTERILESAEDGRDWRDHVVLYRTNAQSRGVEEQLLSARVPYVVLGGTNFYDRREVKDLLAYLRVAAGLGKFEDVRRSINTPFRFLGKAFLDSLQDQMGEVEGPRLIQAVRDYVTGPAKLQARQKTSAITYCQLIEGIQLRMRAGELSPTPTRDSVSERAAMPSVLLESLIMDLRYSEWLTKDEGAESPENNRVSNVRELVRAAGRFPKVTELLEYIDDTIKRSELAKRSALSSDVVTLCSIHRSKGLEWPVVFVIGCNEKILPHAYAEDPLEERRLFYVACTRAADVLQLSYVARAAISNRVVDLKPSPYLIEAGVELPAKPAVVLEAV